MKKIKYVHIVTGLMLFGIILSISTSAAVAWSNGRHAVGSVNYGDGVLNPIPLYYADYQNPIAGNTEREYYGTHDWIAESALELLYNVRPGNIFLNRLRGDPTTNNMLKIYFLYGTEIPDRSVLSPRFITDCDYQFIRSTFGPERHTPLYFNGDGSPRDDTAARVADKLFHQVVMAFEAKDCQRAAAYIGAIMHMISDATMYNHVLDNVGRQATYEAHVEHVTFRKWSEGTRELWPGITEFFSVFEAQEMLTAFTSISPYMATMRAGKDTRFGGLFFRDAIWMFERRPTVDDHGFWDNVNGPVGSQYTLEHAWTYQMRPTGNTFIADYFDTIEHNLNMAVFYCAAALSFILNNAGYTDCSCLGDWPTQTDDSGQGRRDRSDLKVQVDDFTGLFFFNIAGLFATGVALALLSKLNILEKLIPA